MKLFIYDHCPFCIRTRMIFGLKNIPIELITLTYEDETTPKKLIGQKMLPILQKQDDSYMPESLDIVNYIDQAYGGEAVLIGHRNPDITQLIKQITAIDSILVYPRYIQLGLDDFASQAAIDYFVNKKYAKVGAFDQCLSQTEEIVNKLEKVLAKLDKVISSAKACNGQLSLDDICLFPLLRNLTCVKTLAFPTHVKNYIETMSKQTKINLYFDIAI